MTSPTKPIIDYQDDPRTGFHRRMGLAATVMMRSPTYWRYPIACLAEWVEPAILLNQIHFLSDHGGNVIGYVTWAFLAEDTEHRWIHDAEVKLHISEWNEGERLWILDFVLLDGKVRDVLSQIQSLFPEAPEAKSLRRRADGTVRKVTTWRMRHE